MKAHSHQQSSRDQTSPKGAWVALMMSFVLVVAAFPQVGCVSAKSFSYGYNEEGTESAGAIRTSRLTTNGRRRFELNVADKSLGEVFSTLSSKLGAPVLLGFGVEPESRISGVFSGATWGEVVQEVCTRQGFIANPKRYPSGNLEAYVISKP